MNDLFACDTCQHIDAFDFAYPRPNDIPTGPLKCTLCQTGQWHNLISYRPYDPKTDIVTNRPSNLGMD